MQKKLIIILTLIIGIIILDTIQARILKNSPIISWKEELSNSDSWVDKGIIINTYYCVKERDIVTVSWHFKTSKFICPKNDKEEKYNGYKKISTLKNNSIDTNTLVFFNNNLYGRSYKLIDYEGFDDITTSSIGIIDKLIDYEYIPKLNGETNKDEILNALVYAGGNNDIVILYNNEYVLFEKIH